MSWLIEAYLDETDGEITRDDLNGEDRFSDAKLKKKNALKQQIYNSPGATSAANQAEAEGEDPEVAKAIYTQKALNNVEDKAEEYNNAFKKLTKKNKNYYPPDSTVKAVRRHNEK